MKTATIEDVKASNLTLDEMVDEYDNFHRCGELEAGECGYVRLYTLDYGTFWFRGEQVHYNDDREMTGITQQQAMQLLIDWWDKENAQWTADQAESAKRLAG